jgi:hypothetical protein
MKRVMDSPPNSGICVRRLRTRCVPQPECYRLGLVPQPIRSIEALEVRANRRLSKAKNGGDFLLGKSFGRQLKNLPLAACNADAIMSLQAWTFPDVRPQLA